jgi:hypothetical protein
MTDINGGGGSRCIGFRLLLGDRADVITFPPGEATGPVAVFVISGYAACIGTT